MLTEPIEFSAALTKDAHSVQLSYRLCHTPVHVYKILVTLFCQLANLLSLYKVTILSFMTQMVLPMTLVIVSISALDDTLLEVHPVKQ